MGQLVRAIGPTDRPGPPYSRRHIGCVSMNFAVPLLRLLTILRQRTRYLNAANTFRELLSMGVVPIVNENDTVSVSVSTTVGIDTLPI